MQVAKKSSANLKNDGTTLSSIIESASIEFAEKGFAGARMDSIADRANVNKATIYYHIGGKASLYKDVIKNLLGDIVNQLNKRVDSQPNAEAKLHAHIQVFAENIISSPHFAPIMLREIASGGENMSEEIFALMRLVIKKLQSILKLGEKEGAFKNTDVLTTHLMIVGSVNFLAASGRLLTKVNIQDKGREQMTTQNFAAEKGEAITSILLDGLKKRGEKNV